jgi:hypothetical protein
MALFNLNIGAGGSGGYRLPPAKPNGMHWTLIALLPICVATGAAGQAGIVIAGFAVWAGFFYGCWIVGRWFFFSATQGAARMAGGMAHGYPQPPQYPPPHPQYPPQPQGYPPHYAPPPQQPYEAPHQGYAWPPRPEQQG